MMGIFTSRQDKKESVGKTLTRVDKNEMNNKTNCESEKKRNRNQITLYESFCVSVLCVCCCLLLVGDGACVFALFVTMSHHVVHIKFLLFLCLIECFFDLLLHSTSFFLSLLSLASWQTNDDSRIVSFSSHCLLFIYTQTALLTFSNRASSSNRVWRSKSTLGPKQSLIDKQTPSFNMSILNHIMTFQATM
jgi:hypothetical protein